MMYYYKILAFSLFLFLLGCEDESKLRAIKKRQLIDQKVNEKINNWTSKKEFKCQQNTQRIAVNKVDSMILAQAYLKAKNYPEKPNKPQKPKTPTTVYRKDTSSLIPIIPDSI